MSLTELFKVVSSPEEAIEALKLNIQSDRLAKV